MLLPQNVIELIAKSLVLIKITAMRIELEHDNYTISALSRLKDEKLTNPDKMRLIFVFATIFVLQNASCLKLNLNGIDLVATPSPDEIKTIEVPVKLEYYLDVYKFLKLTKSEISSLITSLTRMKVLNLRCAT